MEASALGQAERECTEDAADRAQARFKAAEVRRRQDLEFVERIAEQLLVLFPACPPREARAIAEHTAKRGSGRIGRTAAARNLEESALSLAVAAAVRHQHTNYDELLAAGVERALARHKVIGRVEEILDAWRAFVE